MKLDSEMGICCRDSAVTTVPGVATRSATRREMPENARPQASSESAAVTKNLLSGGRWWQFFQRVLILGAQFRQRYVDHFAVRLFQLNFAVLHAQQFGVDVEFARGIAPLANGGVASRVGRRTGTGWGHF